MGNTEQPKFKVILEEGDIELREYEPGSPVFAFYNPPWTLPFLRRNEVMIQFN